MTISPQEEFKKASVTVRDKLEKCFRFWQFPWPISRHASTALTANSSTSGPVASLLEPTLSVPSADSGISKGPGGLVEPGNSTSLHKRMPRLENSAPSAHSSLAPPVTQDAYNDLRRRLTSLEAENKVLENNRQAFSNAIENLERAKLEQTAEQQQECAGIDLRIDFGRRQIEIFEKREAALRALCERMLRLTGYDPILLSAYDTVDNVNLDPEVVLATHIQIAIQNGLDMWHKILPPVTGARLTDDFRAVDRLKRQSLTEAEQDYKMMKLWREIAKESGDRSVTPSVSNVSSLGAMPLSASRQFAVNDLLDRYRDGSMPPRRFSDLDASAVVELHSQGMSSSESSDTIRPGEMVADHPPRDDDTHSASPDDLTTDSAGDPESGNSVPPDATISSSLSSLPSDSQLYRPESFLTTQSTRRDTVYEDDDPAATPKPLAFDPITALDWPISIDAIQGILSSEGSLPFLDIIDGATNAIVAAPSHDGDAAPTTYPIAMKSSSSRRSSASASSTRRRRTSVTFATDAASRPAPQMPPKRRTSRPRVSAPMLPPDYSAVPPPLPETKATATLSRPTSILRMPHTVEGSASFESNMASLG
uniref:Uncharacterized protein n=1 Tax=Schizophyllum commune (strain H4-8 / FGSC 9210) TaxID=578458 RepID=D8PVK7_SCHCM